MKPIFIFIIIISIVAVYFIFFNKGNKFKCVNDTKTLNKFGLLPVPCLVTGTTLDETTAYINNLNNVMKNRVPDVSELNQTILTNVVGSEGMFKLTDDEQKTIQNYDFVLASMPFSNAWDGIDKKYIIIKNDTPAKYIPPDNIKVVVSGLQKTIYNINISLTKLYTYMDKQTTLTDALASTITTFISLYILYNNILNFIQTH